MSEEPVEPAGTGTAPAVPQAPGSVAAPTPADKPRRRSKASVFLMSFVACSVVVLAGAIGIGTIAYYLYEAYYEVPELEADDGGAAPGRKGVAGPPPIPPPPVDKLPKPRQPQAPAPKDKAVKDAAAAPPGILYVAVTATPRPIGRHRERQSLRTT